MRSEEQQRCALRAPRFANAIAHSPQLSEAQIKPYPPIPYPQLITLA